MSLKRLIEVSESKAAGRPAPALSHRLSFEDSPSKVKPEFLDGTRLDSILKRYRTSGGDMREFVGRARAHLALQPFGAQEIPDYTVQLQRVVEVESYFRSLPSALRAQFDNDPHQMVTFMANPANLAECVKLGLIAADKKPIEETPPAPTPATPPVTPPK